MTKPLISASTNLTTRRQQAPSVQLHSCGHARCWRPTAPSRHRSAHWTCSVSLMWTSFKDISYSIWKKVPASRKNPTTLAHWQGTRSHKNLQAGMESEPPSCTFWTPPTQHPANASSPVHNIHRGQATQSILKNQVGMLVSTWMNLQGWNIKKQFLF